MTKTISSPTLSTTAHGLTNTESVAPPAPPVNTGSLKGAGDPQRSAKMASLPEELTNLARAAWSEVSKAAERSDGRLDLDKLLAGLSLSPTRRLDQFVDAQSSQRLTPRATTAQPEQGIANPKPAPNSEMEKAALDAVSTPNSLTAKAVAAFRQSGAGRVRTEAMNGVLTMFAAANELEDQCPSAQQLRGRLQAAEAAHKAAVDKRASLRGRKDDVGKLVSDAKKTINFYEQQIKKIRAALLDSTKKKYQANRDARIEQLPSKLARDGVRALQSVVPSGIQNAEVVNALNEFRAKARVPFEVEKTSEGLFGVALHCLNQLMPASKEMMRTIQAIASDDEKVRNKAIKDFFIALSDFGPKIEKCIHHVSDAIYMLENADFSRASVEFQNDVAEHVKYLKTLKDSLTDPAGEIQPLAQLAKLLLLDAEHPAAKKYQQLKSAASSSSAVGAQRVEEMRAMDVALDKCVDILRPSLRDAMKAMLDTLNSPPPNEEPLVSLEDDPGPPPPNYVPAAPPKA